MGLSCYRFFGRDPFNQNFRKFRSKTQWIGSVQPEKFRKNGSTFWGGPIFPVGPVGILVEWIASFDWLLRRCTGNWVKTRAPKHSHSEIEHENDPVAITSLQNDKWGRALEVFSSSTAFSSLLILVLWLIPKSTGTKSYMEVNPLNPKIKLWILICCLYSFPTEVVGRSW